MSETVAEQRQLEYIPIRELELLELRDIRDHIVEDIADRIKQSEYNPARPMRVVPRGDGYAVVDGNHRLSALQQLESVRGNKPIPCVVEHGDVDLYQLAHESNQDESTFAEEDLFDHVDYIDELRDEHTQAEIAERLGWKRGKVNHYTRLINEVDTAVLELARVHQAGRVSRSDTPVSITDFTEYWFRTSGLYDLNRDGVDSWDGTSAQMRVMRWFVDDQNCDASKGMVKRKVESVLEVCAQLDQLEADTNPAVDETELAETREQVTAGAHTDESLAKEIERLNQGAKNRACFETDALEGLATVEPNSVPCVVTDPPYGIEFDSYRSEHSDGFDADASSLTNLLRPVFEELRRVCQADAHLYVFFTTEHYQEVYGLLSEFFEVSSAPLIWVKNLHAPNAPSGGGFDMNYAQKYEPIFHCRMPKGDQRGLNGDVCTNVLQYAGVQGADRWHDTQKPRPLLRELIENSTAENEPVLDPFAGSGSTLLAAAEAGRRYIGFEQDDYGADFQHALREIKGGE